MAEATPGPGTSAAATSSSGSASASTSSFAKDEETEFTCALCLDFTSDNPEADYFVSTECGHLFHYYCIKAAFDNGYKDCPIDRKRIDMENLRKLYGIHPQPKFRIPYSCYNPSAPGVDLLSLDCLDDVPKPVEYDYKFKIILVGDSGAGKSSLLQRYADDKFSTNLYATVGCDWRTKTIEIGGKVINLSIWDTVGQEKYRSLVTNYVRETHGALLVYDITNAASTENLDGWLNFVADNALPETVSILIGNKNDLEEHREVPKVQGKKIAEKLNLPFFEASAKNSYNVEAAFRLLVAKILESDDLVRMAELKKKHPNIQLSTRIKNQQEPRGFGSMCSQSYYWAKTGWSGTVKGVKNGWNYVTKPRNQDRD